MIIYIDSDYKCYTEPADERVSIETDFFDRKSKAYIEGYRFVPTGCTWIREDGMVFHGEMISPWKDSQTLDLAQSAYEELLIALATSYAEGVNSI